MTEVLKEDITTKGPSKKSLNIDEPIVQNQRSTSVGSKADWDSFQASDLQSNSKCMISSNQLFIESLELLDEDEQDKILATDDDFAMPKDNTAIKEDEAGSIPNKQGIAEFLSRHVPQEDVVAYQNRKPTNSVTYEFDLKHYDKEGNLLTPKEAYKELSRKFHGTGLGKRRREKRLLKKAAEQQKLQTESCRVAKPRKPQN